jgi:hypothetical protein
MSGWWIAMGVLAAAVLALTPRLIRRRQRRRRLDMIRARVEASLSVLKQPVDSPLTVCGGEDPPTFSSAPSPLRTADQQRRTLMFGALYPDISVGSRRVA